MALTSPDHEVAIIGAGPGGIAAAHSLRRHGIDDFVIVERGGDFGGTWRDNHYPGLAVDIPSLWYQLSFAPNPDWSRLFAPGPELHRYLQDTATKFGLYDHLIPNAEVTQQRWDEIAGVWRLSIDGGTELTARFLISSVGGYVNAKPKVDIVGVENFAGTVLRPNEWDDSYVTTGKRIAVIGTGSSGVQISAALSAGAAQLDVYQRTPAWVLPKIDFDLPPALRRVLRIPGVLPVVNAAGRLVMDAAMIAPIVHVFSRLPDRLLVRLIPLYDAYCRVLYRLLLRLSVRDAQTRAALVPMYGIVAKRPVISSAFFRALNNANTELITTPIERITRDGVCTTDGVERPVDLLVLATGYELWTDPETYRPGTILGTDGFDLAEFYRAHGMQSYAGTAHPQLPNRWEIVGPNGFVGFAWCDFVETMALHAARVIARTRGRGAQVAAVTERAFARWNAQMARRGKTAHLYFTDCNPGLRTYFVNSRRETVYHRPQTITGSRWFARRGPLDDYRFDRHAAPALSEELPA